MINLTIDKQDETYLIVRVDDDAMRKNLDQYFCYKPKNVQFTPRYKAAKGKWDGSTHLYNVPTGKIFSGLFWHIVKFAEDNDLNVVYNYVPETNNVTIEQTINFIDRLKMHTSGVPLEVYDYQIEAVYHTLKYSRALLLSPTSSGKSAIIYVLVRALLSKKKRILISVPSTMLVNQLIDDFKDYSSEVSWDAEKACTSVFYGSEKDFGKEVVIGTWQSLVKLDKTYLETFDVIIADEAHGFKADVVSGLIKSCKNAQYRIGTTGTLDGKILSAIYLQGIFGAIHKTISIRDLIDSGRVATPIIHCAALNYPLEVRKTVDISDYQVEMDWLVTCEARMKFITNLASKCKGNTLVMFQFVEKHGKPLYEMMKTHLKNKTVLYISGEVDLDDREDIKTLFKERNDIVLVCSSGTMSTGVSIRQIDNLILGSPSKSRIRLWQSIGRVLRLYLGKTHANIFDISDNLKHSKKVNYTWIHAKERALEYENEKIDYNITEVEMSRYFGLPNPHK